MTVVQFRIASDFRRATLAIAHDQQLRGTTAESLASRSTAGPYLCFELDFILEDSWTFWQRSSAKRENLKSS
jgi:hypothetical protein